MMKIENKYSGIVLADSVVSEDVLNLGDDIRPDVSKSKSPVACGAYNSKQELTVCFYFPSESPELWAAKDFCINGSYKTIEGECPSSNLVAYCTYMDDIEKDKIVKIEYYYKPLEQFKTELKDSCEKTGGIWKEM